jgi:hypothetical protein
MPRPDTAGISLNNKRASWNLQTFWSAGSPVTVTFPYHSYALAQVHG